MDWGWKRNILLVCLLAELTLASNNREKKLFSVFNIITFKNDPCKAKSDPTMTGTCYTTTECISRSGTTDGNCAAGFGVCCTFTLGACGSTVGQNISYIQNPAFPNTYSTTGSCGYTVNYVQGDICELRLDFAKFDLTDVVATGICTDSFTATGPTGRNPPVICGVNTGQHMYVETGTSKTATTLVFQIAATGGGSWKIKISQIECSNPSRPPFDCQQYFTGASGEIKSYNFDGGIMLSNQLYTICIRQERGFCGIQYAPQENTTPDSYDLSATATSSNGGATATGQTAFIAIPGSTLDYYSGSILQEVVGAVPAIQDGTVSAFGLPFTIEVTNTNQAQTSANGFDLVYSQIPC